MPQAQGRIALQGQDGFVVTPSDTLNLESDAGNLQGYKWANLYTGSGGTISVIFARSATDTVVQFTNVPAGVFLPIAVKRVRATGTTATGIIATTGEDQYR